MNPRTTIVRSDSDTPRATARSAGLEGVGLAIGRAIKSQFHPNMLFALLLPFLITMIGAIVLIWFAWDPLTAWIDTQATQSAVITTVDEWVMAVGLFSLKAWLIPFAAVLILLPVSGIIGLAVAAVWVMPMVVSHLSKRDYPDVKKQGRNVLVFSVWNAIWVSVLFVAGWVLTLPLWLMPPMALLLSIFWWAFAYTRMMRVDSMVEHASPEERKVLLSRHYVGYWTIGLGCALVNLLPPAWLFLPVFSGLVFTHYSLECLRRLRAETVIDI